MIDKDFEVAAERAAKLFTNAGYFARYRELLATVNCREAWEQTESEMPFGLRRFTSYDSFKKALRQERRDALPLVVRLQVDAAH